MPKRLSSAAIVALKEALCTIYWYKADLRSFLQNCVRDISIVAALDWGDSYKREIVSDLVDKLCLDQDHYLGDLTKLCYEVTNLTEFGHLTQLDGGREKAKRAQIAVDQLKKLLNSHVEAESEDRMIAKRQKMLATKLAASGAVRQRLNELKSDYATLATSENVKQRGFDLEKLMYDLFNLFDLDPKASFRNIGEQIDGAFCLDGTDYLFEAKWQKEQVNSKELDSFAAKIARKLENTLGVFLSINGFSQNAVTLHSRGKPSIVLMDGSDLMAVLEERMDFVSLLLRKKPHAARTGDIYLPIHKIIV